MTGARKIKVTMSPRGQVVIPAKVRKELGIESGMELIVFVEGGRIILKPVSSQRAEFLQALEDLDKSSINDKVDVVDEIRKQRR